MTQGLLTVVKNNKVILKIIVGCEGYNIDMIERLVSIERNFSSPKIFYEMARNVGFGCDSCRVVLTKDKEYYSDEIDELSELYRKTFNKPKFNPRRMAGTADCIRVLQIL